MHRAVERHLRSQHDLATNENLRVLKYFALGLLWVDLLMNKIVTASDVQPQCSAVHPEATTRNRWGLPSTATLCFH